MFICFIALYSTYLNDCYLLQLLCQCYIVSLKKELFSWSFFVWLVKFFFQMLSFSLCKIPTSCEFSEHHFLEGRSDVFPVDVQ